MTGADRLRAEGLTPRAWSNGPGVEYGAHAHADDKVLVCERGSITFRIDAGQGIELGPGDRLELPAGTRHVATVGPAGVECIEAYRTAGSVPRVRVRSAGSW